MRPGIGLLLLAVLASLAAHIEKADAQQRRYAWSDIDCRQSRLAAWSGLKCRATNVVTNEGNVGAFRQWAAFGSGRGGYYAHLFLWEAQNGFSYLSADETTADFARWMFEDYPRAILLTPGRWPEPYIMQIVTWFTIAYAIAAGATIRLCSRPSGRTGSATRLA